LRPALAIRNLSNRDLAKASRADPMPVAQFGQAVANIWEGMSKIGRQLARR
jgi:hypothetical protein